RYPQFTSVGPLFCASILAAALLLFMADPKSADAKILLVSKAGVDNADCSTSVCLTIAHAMKQASAGDKVSVSAGTYNEVIHLRSGVQLVSDSRATVQGRVIVENAGPGTTLEGFTINSSFKAGIVIENSTAEIHRNYIT